jgi:hypothetical protein
MIEIKMAGGIGNQLFQYFAGWSLANKLNTGIVLDYSQWSLHDTVHGETIEKFNLSGSFKSPKQFGFIARTLARTDRRLLRKYSLYRRVNAMCGKRWFATTIGYEENLKLLPSGSRISGYFQTWRYFADFKDKNENFQLTLSDMSKECYSLALEAAIIKPIMVHVRRGDYKNLSNSFGVLSNEYYVQALAEARKLLPQNPIWLFSDEVDIAVEIFSSTQLKIDRVIYDQDLLDATESLYLMTRCAGHVVANSTFSWWGAALSKSSEIVIAPNPWFRGIEEPLDLIPTTWLRINSKWETLEL